MENVLHGIYGRSLGRNKLKTLEENMAAIRPLEKHLNCTLEEVIKKIKTSRDFDYYFIARILGCSTAENLYRKASCVTHIEEIAVPTLFLSSLNDPIITYHAQTKKSI